MGLNIPLTAIFNNAEDAEAYADRLEEIKFSIKGRTVTINAPEGIIDFFADDSQEFYDNLEKNRVQEHVHIDEYKKLFRSFVRCHKVLQHCQYRGWFKEYSDEVVESLKVLDEATEIVLPLNK